MGVGILLTKMMAPSIVAVGVYMDSKLLDQFWHRADEVFRRIGRHDTLEMTLRAVKDFPSADCMYKECLGRGGVHVFSRSLRVFGLTDDKNAQNIIRWNNPATWKEGYKVFFSGVWVFAEDVFGYQFLFDRQGVGLLDIETGNIRRLCSTFSEWIALVEKDPNFYSGVSVADEWDKTHPKEPLSGMYHLCPVTLFVCGGTYDMENLFRFDGEHHLSVKAGIAQQLKDLPDGTQIEFTFD